MAKMGKKHEGVHKAFLDLKRPFEPMKVYEAMCKLVKLGEDAIERGIGRLHKDGKLGKDPNAKRAKSGKRGKSGRGGVMGDTGLEDFR